MMDDSDDIQPYSGNSPAIITIEIIGSDMVLRITGPERFRRVLDVLHREGFTIFGDEALDAVLSLE
jgi:hypothetical protein